jgi:hypothetical protein
MEDIHEFQEGRGVEGVQAVRTVERNGADSAIMTDEYSVRTVSHVTSVFRAYSVDPYSVDRPQEAAHSPLSPFHLNRIR